LATVYGIIKQSDGDIWVYSEPGQGTTFKTYLPLIEGPGSRPQVRAQPGRPSVGETVLVVEDEASVRAIMKRALEGAGYGVIEAGFASEAIEFLTKYSGRISLVLTDVVMPGKSGPELADQIKKLAPSIPVLFTSGYPDGEITRRGLLEPGTLFLQKPFTPTALVRAVQDRLGAPAPPHH
jgi:CheY-like chemotaxis protein